MGKFLNKAILIASLAVLTKRVAIMARTYFVKHKIGKDYILEQIVFDKSRKLKSLIQQETMTKLEAIIQRILARLASGNKDVDFYHHVKQEVQSNFYRLSEEQSNLLSFYVLAEITRILTVREELESRLNGMNEMSEVTSLSIQMIMERRTSFIKLLSNIMVNITSTQDTLIQNIK